jgi:hypothetical protein
MGLQVGHKDHSESRFMVTGGNLLNDVCRCSEYVSLYSDHT